MFIIDFNKMSYKKMQKIKRIYFILHELDLFTMSKTPKNKFLNLIK